MLGVKEYMLICGASQKSMSEKRWKICVLLQAVSLGGMEGLQKRPTQQMAVVGSGRKIDLRNALFWGPTAVVEVRKGPVADHG